jgi:uncharacterized membrane protein
MALDNGIALWNVLLVLVVILFIKLLIEKSKQKFNAIFLVIALALFLLNVIHQQDVFAKLYPVFVSSVLFIVFFTSLFIGKKSIIERLASLKVKKEEQTPFFKKYCTNVTKVWCLFFVVNGCISFITIFMDTQIWTLYNGVISYILMGLLFTFEYIARIYFRKKDVDLEK